MPVRPTVKTFLFFSDFGQKHLRVSFDVEKSYLERKNARNQELKNAEKKLLDADYFILDAFAGTSLRVSFDLENRD